MSDKIAEKISALLLKAESTTPAEAEALTAKAEQLMVKYGVEQAVIEARRAKTGKATEEIITKRILFHNRYAAALIVGAAELARAVSGESISPFQTRYEKNRRELGLVGYTGDVEQAALLIASLQLQSVVALAAWWSTFDHYGMTRMEMFKERRSFVERFFYGAAARVRETRRVVVKEQESKTAGSELALRDRKAAVRAYVDDNLNLRAGRGGYQSGRAGASAGYSAGRAANVGGSSLGAGRRAVNA